jgi:hypothetical protein
MLAPQSHAIRLEVLFDAAVQVTAVAVLQREGVEVG